MLDPQTPLVWPSLCELYAFSLVALSCKFINLIFDSTSTAIHLPEQAALIKVTKVDT